MLKKLKNKLIYSLIVILLLFITACGPNKQSTVQEQLYEAETDFIVGSIAELTDEDEQYDEVYKSEILSIKQVSKHVYQHTSYLDANTPCNGMLIIYGNKAVVFDTTVDDESSSQLIDWITTAMKSEIIAVIPTHYHIDNLGGLNEFHSRGINSYTNDKTIQIAAEKNLPVPRHGFNGYMELKIGDEKVYSEFLGEGHTPDNIIGYFPLENIMFGGCLIKALNDGKGNITEANIEEWPQTVKNVKLRYPNTEKIIIGHGEIGGMEIIDYTIRLFE